VGKIAVELMSAFLKRIDFPKRTGNGKRQIHDYPSRVLTQTQTQSKAKQSKMSFLFLAALFPFLSALW
jgi:hypothetical protein